MIWLTGVRPTVPSSLGTWTYRRPVSTFYWLPSVCRCTSRISQSGVRYLTVSQYQSLVNTASRYILIVILLQYIIILFPFIVIPYRHCIQHRHRGTAHHIHFSEEEDHWPNYWSPSHQLRFHQHTDVIGYRHLLAH